MEHLALEVACIFHADHDVGQLRLENPRRREVIGRPDLAQVGHHRVRAFGTVDAEPAPIGLTEREDEVPDPCHWQVRKDFFARAKIVELGRVLGAFDHVAVRQNHTLRLARGARGVEHHTGVVIGQLFTACLEIGDELVIGGTALVLNMAIFMERMVIVFPHAARIDVDHVLELVQVLLNLDDLVDLLLVLDDREARAAMTKDVFHLFRRAVVIDRDRDRAHGLGRDHREIEMRAVAPDDGDEIAFVYPKVDETEGKSFDLFLGFRPGPGLPDPELLLPICGLLRKQGGVSAAKAPEWTQVPRSPVTTVPNYIPPLSPPPRAKSQKRFL